MNTQTRIEEIQDRIEQLRPRAESGEQWAEICALEAEMVGLQDRVANCDCCDQRPGTHMVNTGALAGETWVCDECVS